MKKRQAVVLSFTSVLSSAILIACGGGSDSSGSIDRVGEVLDCVIEMDTLTLDESDRCNFTVAQVTAYPGFSAGTAQCSIADQEFVVDGVVFGLTANEVTVNSLTLICSD